jgi:hypothetical protein
MPAVRDSERLRVGAALLAGALRVAIAGALLAGASMVSPALAQGGLDAADRAYEEGEVASARDAYETALRSGSLDPAELVRAHLRLGILAALEGDTEGFERRSAFALALDPVRDAPEELAPELRARFEALRDARAGRRATLTIDRDRAAIRIDVRDAPEGLAHRVDVRGGDGFEQQLAWEGTPLRITPPPSALPIEALLLDAHGNRLARAGARLEAVAAITTAPAPAETGARNLLESPWLWVVVAAIVIGIGVAVGVSASGDRFLLEPPVIR